MNKRPKPELKGRCVTGGTDGAAFHRRKPTETGAHPLPGPPLVDTSVSQLFGPGPDSHVSSHYQGLSSMGHPPRRRSGMEGVVEDGLGAWRYRDRGVSVGNTNKGPFLDPGDSLSRKTLFSHGLMPFKWFWKINTWIFTEG